MKEYETISVWDNYDETSTVYTGERTPDGNFTYALVLTEEVDNLKNQYPFDRNCGRGREYWAKILELAIKSPFGNLQGK